MCGRRIVVCYFLKLFINANILYIRYDRKIYMLEASINNTLQFVVTAKGSSSVVATTHPFALNAQFCLKAETLN